MRTIHIAALSALAAGLSATGYAQDRPPALAFPLACQIGRTCEVQHYVDRDPGPGVRDYRCGRRTYEGHSGVDIRLLDMTQQRAGVAVLAAAAGRVARLRDGVADISIRAPGAPPTTGAECGNGVVIDHGGGWETQSCHLARGSIGVKVGDMVKAGDPIGRVGLSGQTEFPHLHLTVRHQGRVIDPFAPEPGAGCGGQAPLWTPAAMRGLAYKAGTVLNAGFAPGPVSMDQVEAGRLPAFGPSSAYLVAYVRASELEAGDVLAFSVTGPDGKILVQSRMAPLDRDKAQHIAYVGKKRPASGWPHGAYSATYQVIRKNQTVIQRRFQAVL